MSDPAQKIPLFRDGIALAAVRKKDAVLHAHESFRLLRDEVSPSLRIENAQTFRDRPVGKGVLRLQEIPVPAGGSAHGIRGDVRRKKLRIPVDLRVPPHAESLRRQPEKGVLRCRRAPAVDGGAGKNVLKGKLLFVPVGDEFLQPVFAQDEDLVLYKKQAQDFALCVRGVDVPRLAAPDGRLFVIVQGAVVQPHPVRRAPKPAVGKHRRTERQRQFICPRRRHADAGLPVRKEHSVPVGKGDAIGNAREGKPGIGKRGTDAKFPRRGIPRDRSAHAKQRGDLHAAVRHLLTADPAAEIPVPQAKVLQVAALTFPAFQRNAHPLFVGRVLRGALFIKDHIHLRIFSRPPRSLQAQASASR